MGVNSDASVRRLGKSPGPPDRPARRRAPGCSPGFAAVDCVVLFDEDTPLELIQALQPDVLVKGADYAREHIVGADFVEARGGRVVRVPARARPIHHSPRGAPACLVLTVVRTTSSAPSCSSAAPIPTPKAPA